MILATFNANSVRTRRDPILSWMAASQADILCIQETKVTDDLFPEAAFREAGYHVIFRGQKSYNGVAIVSRHEADRFGFGFDDEGPADATRLAYATFGDIHIINTYVPQGREITHEMYHYKQDWLRRLKAWLTRHYSPDDKIIWCGDMNVATQAIDIHNADRQTNHVCFHQAVRDVFADTVSWGFTDVFRKHHPDEPGCYTFYDYRTVNAVQRNMGWRIDHILATAPMAALSTGSEIDLTPRLAAKPSDHTFLTATFACSLTS